MQADTRHLARAIRLSVVDRSMAAGVGHIGSALSIADILAALYGGILDVPSPDDPERDRFLLSKGHAGLALYATLHQCGVLSTEELDGYCADGSSVATHPERDIAGIDFSTGSLGHGLSIAAGAALAARLQSSPRRVFCLLSDAECDEGSTWEAAMFAAHHRLANLVAIVDVNGQQALGYTEDVLDLSPLAERWRAFGWEAIEVDGHDPEEIAAVVANLDTADGPPHVLCARTVFGRGVSFMESKLEWHYWPMTAEQHEQAVAEIGAAP